MNSNECKDNLIDTEDNSKIQQSIIKQMLLLIALSIVLFIILPQIDLTDEKKLFILAWIGNITFFISIYLYFRATDSLICPYIMFFCSFFCFQFGQWFLYSLGIKYNYIHTGFYGTLWDNDLNILFNGTKMIIFSIALFNLGALCSFIKSTKEHNHYLINDAMKVVGWALFVITIIPAFFNKIKYMIISKEYGYMGTYLYIKESESIIAVLTNLFIPSCILLIITYKDNKSIKRVFQILMILFSFISLIGGGRTEGISILLVLILYEIFIKKDIKIKSLIMLGINLFLVICLIGTFSDFREVEGKSVKQFSTTLIDNIINKNPVVKSVGEMGWSMGTVFITMKIVPSYFRYDCGSSYLASLSRLIPSKIDPSNVIRRLHEKSIFYANLITEFYNSDFGMGCSLVGESYYNFGYYGVAALFFIGLIIGKILGYTSKSINSNNYIMMYIKLAGLYSLFTLPRREFGYLITQVFYVFVIVIILTFIVRNILMKVKKYK